MAVPRQTRRIFLSEKPQVHITKSTFGSETANLPTPTPDQVIVRTDYLSLDPAMRLTTLRTYVPPVRVGETMRGAGVGTVVHGNNQIKTGDVVYGVLGWAEYVITSAQSLRVLHPPEGFTALDYLGPLGTTGMTAYFGLLEVGELKAGETLVVSAAAGGVGSLVCQIGKIKDAKVIAIASVIPKESRITPLLLLSEPRFEGFVVYDYKGRYGEAESNMTKWIREDGLKYQYQVESGLEQCPQYFELLFSGGNTGKLR
ncbi:N-terminal domain of oxidoreductase, partial [Rhizoctonia solani]